MRTRVRTRQQRAPHRLEVAQADENEGYLTAEWQMVCLHVGAQ